MYIRTRAGLAQGQATWPTLQTFNRPAAQPAPIGYLGDFNEHLGQQGQQICELIRPVPGFRRDSSTLTTSQKKYIKALAREIDRSVKRALRGRKATVNLEITAEGHVDAKTDKQPYGSLDLDRAVTARDELQKEILKIVPWAGVVQGGASGVGTTRPVGSTSAQIRRAVICVRWKFLVP
jgi:hypothetical protein